MDTQLYVFPETAEAPILVLLPKQIALSPPVVAVGNGFTVTMRLLLLVQPVAVIVSVNVYVVVTIGATVGLANAEVNPTGLETQPYVFPETAADPILVLLPKQIALSPPVVAVGNGFTVTVRLLLLVQPVAVMVSVTV